jgi:plasmid maintenance system antidote protein VapI
MKTSKKLTNKELAESYVFPNVLTGKEKEKADQEFLALRMQMLAKRTDDQKLYADVLQLKYKLEDYLNSSAYNKTLTFGYFLMEYLRILNKKQTEFAKEIDLHETRLNRILKDADEPNKQLMYRLEYHSAKIISALMWWRLSEKSAEFALLNDKETQRKEYAKVKNKLAFNF